MPAEEIPPQASTSTLKRSRPSAAAPGSSASRGKRRKAEDGVDTEDSGPGKGKQPVTFGVGMVKGREDEWGEPADVQTKIDFNELPDETLYRYLELHDLLPRWTTSPWSEEPCTPPNALYTLPPQPPAIPIVPETTERVDAMDQDPPSAIAPSLPTPEPHGASAAITTDGPSEGIPKHEPVDGEPVDDAGANSEEPDDEGTPIAPTTRSKTAPFRKAPTPPPVSPSPPTEVKRGVITLSDVHAARAIMAEKANAHWVKGLGGGQNKEGETIVQFLYKMKAGPGRLLRVYNPYPPPFAY